MRCIIIGIAALCLGVFFWIWAIQDGSFSVADRQHEAEWLRRANIYILIGYGLFAGAVAAFVTAWLKGRRTSTPRE